MAKAKKTKSRPAKKRARKKVARQAQVPGTERNKHLDLSEAAEAYQELKESRMDLLKEEIKAKEKLKDMMKSHGLEDYVDDELGLEVVLEHGTTNVKVRKRKDLDEELKVE